MKSTQRNAGFILPVVLCCLLVVAVIAGGMLHYIASGARMAGVFTTTSQCRMSAQAALDMETMEIFRDFNTYYRANLTDWDVLAWYNTSSEHNIGPAGFQSSLMQKQTVNGCEVTVTAISITRTALGATRPIATVTLQATATGKTAAGITVSKCIQETIQYAFQPSTVFDYAYFINNLGWFQGGGVRANGDIRSNGDLNLDGSSWVNGRAYAAVNAALGAQGLINNTARHQTLSQYWADNNQRARPSNPTSNNGAYWAMGYDGTYTANEQQSQLLMPYLGNLNTYRGIATTAGSSIKQQGKTLVNACYSDVGPSGVTNGADQGSIVLDGTTYPIIIDGPVVIDGDVIIKGTVSGQGAIYSGRNIYIVGNLTYSDPPSWSKPDTTPDHTSKNNEGADMLGLAAKGNIVLGNYTSFWWLYSVKNYITPPFVSSYECDASDASIGYPSTFNGNYTAYDGGKKLDSVTTTTGWGNNRVTTTTITETNRRYYECSAGNTLINSLAGNTAITRIDGVLYNNHATMGTVGACSFNGSLVCRDESICYSSNVYFNWDIRLGSQSQDGLNVFINFPMSPSTPNVVSWQEIQHTTRRRRTEP